MPIALLSDIHANLEAFEACRRHARAAGATRLALLGDFVGYGADPAAVVERVMQLQAEGALVLKGNHDDAVARPARYMNDLAAEAMEFSRAQLSTVQKEFLAALPLVAHEGAVCFAHASAASPERWDYLDGPSAAWRCAEAAGTRLTFCGHVHRQMLWFEARPGVMSPFQPVPSSPIPLRGNRRWVAVVGSVGQPRDRRPAAGYALFDPAVGALTFHRVPYDHLAAAQKIRAAGLSLQLARRVEAGI